MRTLCTILALTTFLCCEKVDVNEPTWSRILGSWQGVSPFEEHFYRFADGELIHRVVAAGKIIHTNVYAYAVHGNDIHLLDIESGDGKMWAVSFPTDTTAVLSEMGGLRHEIKQVP